MGDNTSFAEAYPKDWAFLVRNTNQFALKEIISSRIRSLAAAHPAESEQADFLYIDLNSLHVAKCFASCPFRESIPDSLDRQNLRATVRDFILDTVHQNRRRREYPSVVLVLALIRHDYESNILNEPAQQVLKNEAIVVGIENSPWNTADQLHEFMQVPYPSTLHLPLRAPDSEPRLSELGEWQLKRERKFLLSFAGKREPNSAKSGQGPFNGFLLRSALAGFLTQIQNDAPYNSDLSIIFTSPASSARDTIPRIHRAMASSIFCLQPPGDSPTRKGFFESILLGCIPIIFREGTYSNVWKGQVNLEQAVAVIIDEQEIIEGTGLNLIERLKLISSEEIREKQKAIAMLADKMQFGVPESNEIVNGWTADAFGMFLRQLLVVKANYERAPGADSNPSD